MRFGHSVSGFTLIELLVYLAVVGITLTLAVSLAVNLLQAESRGTIRTVVDASAHRALARVEEVLHAASNIDANNSTFGTALGRLTLLMRDAARSPTIFTVSNGRLEVSEGGGVSVPLTAADADVTQFQLTRLNPATAKEGVQIDLVVQYRNPSGDAAYQFSQRYVTGVILR